MSYSIAEVAVPVAVEQTFDYKIPEGLRGQIRVGQRVLVPFRERERVEAFVIALKESSPFESRLRELSALVSLEPELSEADLALARWISEYYLAPLGIVLQTIAPGHAPPKRENAIRYVKLAVPLAELLAQIEHRARRAPQQAALLRALLSAETLPERELLARVGCGPAPLHALAQAGLVTITKKPRERVEFHEAPKTVTLNAGQQHALDAITKALSPRPTPPSPFSQKQMGGVFLLHGVNNSGKTEVYIRACQYALEHGGQAIVLVPEISLTPQLIARFRHHFGEKIAVYHSGLTDSERARHWQRLQSGDAQIAIGVRAAIFAPCPHLKLIVIDEEHESTYKQDDSSPRYHVREVALKRAELTGATVVLGSATPSIESYFHAQQGRYKLLELPERVIATQPPTIKIIDMGARRDLLSPILRAKIEQRLKKNEQVILFLNRLGYSIAICRRCRQTVKCPLCQIALTVHARAQELRCRYCHYRLRMPRCRVCGATELLFVGGGTERLEREVQESFPKAQLRRMDSESVRRGEHAAILEAFRQGQIQILLGTQMIGLGLDFPNVTLVGIVSADTLLDFPDFRAGERTFQLISQAAGRAGRGERPGEVIIQTRHPENEIIQLAAAQNYRAFYAHEIELRKLLEYPPFTQLIRITIEQGTEAKASEHAEKLKDRLESLKVGRVLGPARALPYRLRGRYRWQLVLKSTTEVQKIVWAAITELKLTDSVTVNVDPQL
uniref:Replication restart protein PriA n=1 Tax=uncultured Acetothermia bacterium TaxID=236499 RepID=H5SHZ7_9BACT|nr:primosomal protein N' [uncultured Acetothermia bacterium]